MNPKATIKVSWRKMIWSWLCWADLEWVKDLGPIAVTISILATYLTDEITVDEVKRRQCGARELGLS
jgi:hypothetical protein